MKTNKYSKLIDFGFSPKTLMTLSESEINTLHRNLIESKKSEPKESQTIQTSITKYTPSEVQDAKSKGKSIPGGRAVKMNPDGSMDVTNEGEMSEGKKKKNKKINPFAICTSQLGNEFGTTERHLWNSKQNNKYERCVKAIKQSMNENKDITSVILENKILYLLEKHLKPKMNKGELMDLITKKTMSKPIGKLGSIGVKENTETAPAKPKTKPGIKTPPKPDKDSPYRPKTSPAPKARKEESKESAAATSSPAPAKPTTKPGIKTPPKPDKDSPYRPKTSPAPKARKTMPSWMSFDNIGIKLKK
jgi:hypothetical protein